MNSINIVVLSGNLGGDPDFKYTPNGTAVMNLSVAVNNYAGKEADGSARTKVVWVRCAIWGKFAEAMNRFVTGGQLVKGTHVVVTGNLEEAQAYTDKNGAPRAQYNVRVDQIKWDGSRGEAADYNDDPLADVADDLGGSNGASADPFAVFD